MSYTLIVTKRNGELSYVRFNDFPATIGRAGACTVVIDDSVISQLHVTIGKRFRGGFYLKDKSSSSGTFVNNKRVSKENIGEGQEFYLGDIRCLFCKNEDVDKYKGQGVVYKKGDWYFFDGDNQKGPFTSKEFKKLALKGIIRKDTKIMTEGVQSVANKIQGLIFSEQIDEVASKAPSVPQTSQVESFGDILCPHCWWKFNYEEILYIAEHPDLVGDPICGSDVQKRFLPEKFTSTGKAIDMKGVPCSDMACPKCHVFIPKIALTKNDPMIFSIVGAPNSGKSFLLTSMIYKLRQILPTRFNISMVDADPKANFMIHDYENTFFFSDPDTPVSLNKTEEQGDLYNKVIFDDVVINLPKPIFLQMSRMDADDEADITKTIVMYDNSGESFQPGKDTINNPATLHLGHSESIFYLFDPLQHPLFKSMISKSGGKQVEKTSLASRQEILLDEMVNRIEKNTNAVRPFNKSIYILVTKYDLWKNLLNLEIEGNPWEMNENGTFCLQKDELYNTSLAVRSIIEKSLSTARSQCRGKF